MKKNYVLFIVIAIVGLSISSCIPEGPDTFIQDVPISTNISFTGAGPELSGSAAIDLIQSEFYRENRDKITEVKLIRISFKTDSVSPGNMNGDLLFTLKREDGSILLSKNIPASWPAEYIVDPYEFALTKAESGFVNEYLEDTSNTSITATIHIVESGESAKTLTARVYTVFSMEYEM